MIEKKEHENKKKITRHFQIAIGVKTNIIGHVFIGGGEGKFFVLNNKYD